MIVWHCPVPFLSARAPPQCREELVYLDWSGFRDECLDVKLCVVNGFVEADVFSFSYHFHHQRYIASFYH